jgi:hypothetical protein
MIRLTRHNWKKIGFKTWRCSKCGAERYWDKILQRIVFVKFGKSYYMTPDCNSTMNGDPIYNETYNLITKQ